VPLSKTALSLRPQCFNNEGCSAWPMASRRGEEALLLQTKSMNDRCADIRPLCTLRFFFLLFLVDSYFYLLSSVRC